MSAYEKNMDYDYSEYDYLIGIEFGSTVTRIAHHRLSLEEALIIDESYPSLCMYSYDENYDKAYFSEWGVEAKNCRDNLVKGIYISELCDKVEHLFSIKKTQQTAKDRLYLRAIIRYFEKLHNRVKEIVGLPPRNRYVMTYPSYWNPEQVSYLRSLVQIAGFIDEQDHPDRLLMYTEGESVLRTLQQPEFEGTIKQGYTYMICNIGGSKVKMSLFDIKEPLNLRNNVKSVILREWDVEYMKKSSQLSIGLQNIFNQGEIYVLSILSAPVKRFNIDDDNYQDGFLVNPGEVSSGGEYLGHGEKSDQKKYPGKQKDSRRLDKTRRRDLRHLSLLVMERTGIPMVFNPKNKCVKSRSGGVSIPLSLQTQKLNLINYVSSSPELQHHTLKESISQKDRLPTKSHTISELFISPTELEKYVMEPACAEVILYLKSILQGTVGNSVEAIVLTGDFFRMLYPLELIKNTCNAAGVKVIFFEGVEHVGKFIQEEYCSTTAIVRGAIYKAMDKFIPRVDKSIIQLDERESIDNISPELFVFLDYGLKKTRVSYINTQSGQAPDYANIDYVMDWPGQSASDNDFPTVDIMLIPNNELNGRKKMISLKENSDPIDHLSKMTQRGALYNKYYTFQKDKRGIIMLTHSTKNPENSTYISVDNLSLSQNDLLHTRYNRDPLISAPTVNGRNNKLSKLSYDFNFTVTQKRITFQEFSMMYFEYFTSYLYDYFHSKIGTEYSQCRFCVTRDSLEEPDGFMLSDEDLYSIANKCGMLSADSRHCHNRILVLEHTQATTIFCREAIKSFDIDYRATHLHILQVQLTENRCTLLLNRFPFLREGINVHSMPEREEWSGIYKYEESKRIPFNAMEIICDNLWIHLQTHQHIVLKRCERHQLPHRFFNSDNMHIFKNLLLNYLCTSNLDLIDSEKVNEIYICKSDQEENCCRVYITNMDLFQFCMIPAIDKLFSSIVGYILHTLSHQQIKISNIFVMGVFLFCRNQQDYDFLEDLLLAKLGNIKSLYMDNFGIPGTMNTIQTTKVDSQKRKKQNGFSNIPYRHDNDKQDQDSLARIALSGSVMYGTNPRNRLFERVASKTYAIRIKITNFRNYLEEPRETHIYYTTICKNSNAPIKVSSDDMLIPLIQKGSYLRPVSLDGDETAVSFSLECPAESCDVCIDLVTLEQGGKITWSFTEAFAKSRFFSTIGKIKYKSSSAYPIVVKVRPSQTQSYKFWVEYGTSRNIEPTLSGESILLKQD